MEKIDYRSVIMCKLCCMEIKGRAAMLRHQKAEHPGMGHGTVTCKASGCMFACHTVTVLTDHMRNYHNIHVTTSEHQFDSFADFEAWKAEYEEKHVCKYIVQSTSEKSPHAPRYYGCSRSGFYCPRSGVKRKLKTQGSSKMNGHCISHMCVKDLQGKIHVNFTETHFGHDAQENHLRKDQALKEYSKLLLRHGVSVPDTLLAANFLSKKQRKSLFSKKDLNNIERGLRNQILKEEFNFETKFDEWEYKHSELGLKGNIFFHKAKGSPSSGLENDDFVLCLCTRAQSSRIGALGRQGVCIHVDVGVDSQKEFHCVISLMACLGSRKCLPLAWCLSNVNAYRVKKIFLETLKNYFGIIDVSFLMTNDYGDCTTAWNEVFFTTPTVVFSPTAVDSSIKEAVHEYVLGRERQSYILNQLDSIINSYSQCFDTHIQEWVSRHLPKKEFQTFLNEYFIPTFLENPFRGWARSHYEQYYSKVREFAIALSSILPSIKLAASKPVARCVEMLLKDVLGKFVTAAKKRRLHSPETPSFKGDEKHRFLRSHLKAFAGVVASELLSPTVQYDRIAMDELQSLLAELEAPVLTEHPYGSSSPSVHSFPGMSEACKRIMNSCPSTIEVVNNHPVQAESDLVVISLECS